MPNLPYCPKTIIINQNSKDSKMFAKYLERDYYNQMDAMTSSGMQYLASDLSLNFNVPILIIGCKNDK